MAESDSDIRAALPNLASPNIDRDEAIRLLQLIRGVKANASQNRQLVADLIEQGAYQSLSIVLQRFSKDEIVCQNAIRSIAVFARISESVVSMVEYDLPSLLIKTIRRHMTAITLISLGISLLADSSANMHFKDLVRIHNGIDMISDVMSVHQTNPKILDIAYYALANLTVQSPDNINAMVESGCVRNVIEGMVKFVRVPTLVEGALVVIMNVCRNGVNEQRIVADLNGCHALIEVLKSSSGSASGPVIKQCLMTIGAFAQCQENIDLLLSDRALDYICTKIMEYRQHNSDLLQVGLVTIGKIAADCSESALAAILDTRAVATILSVAKQEPKNVPIQTCVLQIFLSLYSRFTNSHSELLPMIRLFSIPVSLSAMYCFPDNATISRGAVTLMAGILTDNHARCRLESVDLLSILVRVGTSQVNDPPVVRLVLDVVSELLTMNMVNINIPDSHILDLVSYIIAQPNLNPVLLESALRLLSRLMSQDGVGEIVAGSITPIFMDLLNQYQTMKPPVLQIFLSIFGDTALIANGSDILCNSGALQTLLRILSDESRNPVVVSELLETLRKMMRTSLKPRNELKAMGAIRLAETLRFQHSADKRVAKCANDFIHEMESTVVVNSRTKYNNKAMTSVDGFKLPELEQNVRLFLTAGGVLTKHCKTAPPRKRNVFVSTDLRFLVWKESNKKPHSLFMDNCESVVAGKCSPELLRDSMMFASASEALSFAVFMKNGRRLAVEAPTTELRDEWVRSLSALIVYRSGLARLTAKPDSQHDSDEDGELKFND